MAGKIQAPLFGPDNGVSNNSGVVAIDDIDRRSTGRNDRTIVQLKAGTVVAGHLAITLGAYLFLNVLFEITVPGLELFQTEGSARPAKPSPVFSMVTSSIAVALAKLIPNPIKALVM